MRRLLASALSIALVIGLRATATDDDGYPLVLVQQGLSVLPVRGERVFLMREGTSITAAFTQRSPAGGRVRWCPREEVYWDGDSIWDARGRHVFGSAPRDLDRPSLRIDADELVHIDPARPVRAEGRTKGEIAPELLDFYRRFLDQGAGPFPGGVGGRRLVWCPRPLL